MRMLVAMVAILALATGGCATDFGHGFRDGLAREGAAMTADAVADAIDKKLGDDFKEVADGLRGLPGQFPKPPDPKDNSTAYTVGTFLALLLANGIKGGVRHFGGKKEKA